MVNFLLSSTDVQTEAKVACTSRSFVLSVHIFNILFMRNNPSFIWRIVTICAGWSAVAFIVASGPLLVQSEAKGPYFGPSGYW